MRIGFAAPVDPTALLRHIPDLPTEGVYSFPYTAALVNGYLDRGHSVVVFAQSSSPGPKRTYLSKDGNLTVHISRRRKAARLRAADLFLLERRRIARLIRRSDVDVVHAHWTYEFAAAALSSGKATVVTAHDSPLALTQNFAGFYWRRRSQLGTKVLQRSVSLTAVSPTLATEIAASGSRERPIVIANGVETPDGTAVRSVQNVDSPSFMCIANGFDGRKNTASAVKAFQRFRRTLPNSKLTMIGLGHEPGGACERWAQSVGHCTNIEFLGCIPHEQVISLLKSKIDILVHTSRWEACSLAILEAQSYGIPGIGGMDSGGVAYTLGEGNSGILVDVQSAEDISCAMSRLVSDEDFYEQQSVAAISQCQGTFSLDLVVDQYIEVLAKAADSLIPSLGEGGM
ncbi:MULTISPECIES: glycosyltransferase family 4 protein [unclassified Rhodococcus (in: high G+C Gram-positive bacteria)]|uniref:glycosyltransferase family 4 protein n=1 Tax=unclassified Rhodococcus (in: high G+C Gram-positive bacteria) TaxID=192944 RepID=UPI00163A970D|nr:MULTISPECIES: glycosyltransferase family 4 protein [unclassified Rhodococcus (in: high G+C Gram-positive bacteria)]MBC2642716.1 glycosyltransferase family 4 protein [Rhodococcus sp. 3A]MBC2892542.1 glycosyltransferase family 4 protein [Rhodococcus sp. 4CII]